MKPTSVKTGVWNFVQTLIIFGLTLLLAYVLFNMGIHADVLLILYLLGTFIVVLQTEQVILTALSSLLFLGAHALFFVNNAAFHKMSFIMASGTFFAISVIMDILVFRLQKQNEEAAKVAALNQRLYKAIEDLIKVQGEDNLIKFAESNLTNLAEAESHFYVSVSRDDPDDIKKWCFRNSAVCGYKQPDFPDAELLYFPVRSNRKTIGVATVDCSEKGMTPAVKNAVLAFISQMAQAVERNRTETERKADAASFEREKIKTAVMKRLSHDMYPRVQTIHKLSSAMLEEGADLSPETLEKNLTSIQEESRLVGETVDNIFDINKN